MSGFIETIWSFSSFSLLWYVILIVVYEETLTSQRDGLEARDLWRPSESLLRLCWSTKGSLMHTSRINSTDHSHYTRRFPQRELSFCYVSSRLALLFLNLHVHGMIMCIPLCRYTVFYWSIVLVYIWIFKIFTIMNGEHIFWWTLPLIFSWSGTVDKWAGRCLA